MVAPSLSSDDAALSLTLAVVTASVGPLLLLDEELRVAAASTSFYRAFQLEPSQVRGRVIDDVGLGEWGAPGLRSLLLARLAGEPGIEPCEMDLATTDRGTRRMVLHAQKLDYEDLERARLVLALIDVTDARVEEKLKADILREKMTLLLEVRHRMANSLQIIASVLLQNARRTQSEETRAHLHDAHQRVMSVAALEQQLATSTLGEVNLRAYFTALCASIGAAMIRDHDQLSLQVDVDDSMVAAEVSVSLGLMVTELVINALKHGFPDARHGAITVRYRALGPDWSLSVTDDGIGMAADRSGTKVGLGTSIVEALANQLRAEVRRSDAEPGAVVSVVHSGAVAANPTPRPAPAA